MTKHDFDLPIQAFAVCTLVPGLILHTGVRVNHRPSSTVDIVQLPNARDETLQCRASDSTFGYCSLIKILSLSCAVL